MNQLWIIFIIATSARVASGQTLQEKLLRESPKLSFNIGLAYESNLQKAETYQNQQLSSFRISPRYRINKTYTLLGSAGFAQAMTQENRSDWTNTSVSLSRRPIALGKIADLRPTATLVLPTNERQRKKDSFQSAFRVAANAFFRTHSPLILGLGTSFRQNIHKFNISAENGANIQSALTPFLTLGWALGKFQFVTQNAYTQAKTYRGTQREIYELDQSISYIPSAELSFALGHNNRGSVLSRDGQASNVEVFDTKTSVLYISVLYNY